MIYLRPGIIIEAEVKHNELLNAKSSQKLLTIDMFKSDFKFVAKYFQTKRKNKEYKPTWVEKEVKARLFTEDRVTGKQGFNLAAVMLLG